MRDSDVRLGVQEALGALFRAGVPLDFAARYPASRSPSSICCPDIRERTGRRLTSCATTRCSSGRASTRTARWSATRCPASAHALRGAAFGSGFPLDGGPPRPSRCDHAGRRLHRADPGGLRRRPRAHRGAGVPPALPRSEGSGAAADRPAPGPQCAGHVHVHHLVATLRRRRAERAALPGQGQADGRRPSALEVPMRLADLDRSRFAPSVVADERDFYERLDAVLSETFQYGPHFRTIQRVLVDTVTRAYLVDIEMDEALWTSGRERGLRLVSSAVRRRVADLPVQSPEMGRPLRGAATGRGRDVHSTAERVADHLPRDEARRGLARRERKGSVLGPISASDPAAASASTTARPGTSSPTSTSTPTSPPTRAGTTCRTAST